MIGHVRGNWRVADPDSALQMYFFEPSGKGRVMLRRRWAALALAGCLLTNSGCFGLMDRCCNNNAGIGNGQLVGRMFGHNQTAVAPASYAGGMPIHTGMPGGSGDCTCGQGQGDGLYHPVGMSHGGAPQGYSGMTMSPEMGPPSGIPIQTLPATTTPSTNTGPRITPVPMSPPGVSPSGFAAPQSPWHP